MSPTETYERVDSSQISKLMSVRGDPHSLIGEIVGPEFVDYRQKWEKAVQFEIKLPYPLHIDFEIFYRCNLKCQMCVMKLPRKQQERYGNSESHIDFDIFKQIIDKGTQEGLRSIGFNGINEPLLQKDIVEWIRYSRKQGIVDVMFNTNGLLLNERLSRELVLSGLTRIMISIDAATPNTYKTIRGVDGFHKVLKNVDQLIEIKEKMNRRLPVVRVSFVKMSNNNHELEKFIEMWKDKVDFYSIQHYGNPLIPGEDFYEQYEQYHTSTERLNIHFRCPQPWVRLMIRHNGDINPCCGIQGPRLILGNLYKNDIREIWMSERFDELREIHKNGTYRTNRICRLCAESLHYR